MHSPCEELQEERLLEMSAVFPGSNKPHPSWGFSLSVHPTSATPEIKGKENKTAQNKIEGTKYPFHIIRDQREALESLKLKVQVIVS